MVITAAEAFAVNSLKFYLFDIKKMLLFFNCIHLNLCACFM